MHYKLLYIIFYMNYCASKRLYHKYAYNLVYMYVYETLEAYYQFIVRLFLYNYIILNSLSYHRGFFQNSV